jgi:hypothetical protein
MKGPEPGAFTQNYLGSAVMIVTAARRLNLGLPPFAKAIFHPSIILDQVAQ